MAASVPPLLRASWAEISLKMSDLLQEPRVLGRGASSIVYRARWLQCDVAAKVLHNNSPSLVDSAALFRELELLRSWGQHECLTSTFAICDDLPKSQGEVCILTQLAPFGNLQQYQEACNSADQPLHLSQILRIGLDIVDAMTFCHAHGLVHGNLKPQNVLIFQGGRAKVSDCVRAKLSSSGGEDNGTGEQHCAYSAPECLADAGDSSASSAAIGPLSGGAADVYSFGVVLWELITRQRPWGNKTATQIIISVYKGETLPLPPLGPLCTDGLRSLLKRCLNKDPLQRPAFALLRAELATELQAEQIRAPAASGSASASAFLCPLGRLPMMDPVVLADGFSYERCFVDAWLLRSDVSPVTGELLLSKATFPNTALKRAILDWASGGDSSPAAVGQAGPHSLGMSLMGGGGFDPTPSRAFGMPPLPMPLPMPMQAQTMQMSIPLGAIPAPPGVSLPLGAMHAANRSPGGMFTSSPGHGHELPLRQQHLALPQHQQHQQHRGLGRAGDFGWAASDHDDDIPASAASSLLMSMVGLGGVGPAPILSSTGSVGGPPTSFLTEGVPSNMGNIGAWRGVGGGVPMPLGGTGSLLNSSLGRPFPPSSVGSDDVDEPQLSRLPQTGGGGLRPLAQAYRPADDAGRALKALVTRAGSSPGSVDPRALRRAIALCASKPDVLSWQDSSDGGSTVLHEAARLNMRETVRVLLRTPGINVNAQDYSGATALRVAVNLCSTPIVRSLAEHPGVDVRLASLDGATPLSSCRGQSALKFTEIRRALHRAGAAEGTDEAPVVVHAAPDHVRAEVFSAVAQRDIATLNTLARAWEHAPEVFNDGDARDRGITPLMAAAADKESTAALSLLLSLPGIEVNKADHSGETALHVCCRCGNLEGLSRLVASAEADPNKQDIRRGRTPLMAAIKEGNRELVKALLLLPELDLSLQDYRGETALSVANKSPELRPLLQREMDQQAAGPTEGIDAALLAALASLNIASGSSNGVGLLASPPSATNGLNGLNGLNGINGLNGLNGTSGGATTDVSSALRSGNLTAVGECLLAAAKIGDAAVFAKVEAELGAVEEVWNYADASYSQFTPLHYSVMNDHVRLVRALCMNPCVDVNRADAENSTPAHVAVLHDRRECLRVLLTHEQIDLRRRDRNTDTPLSMCARHDRRNCARHLAVHHSARRFINSTNPGGLTALNIAAFNGFVEIVKHLIGAPDIDVNKPNKKNSTPLIEAVRKGKTDIVRLLLKHPKIDLTHRCSYGGDALASSLRFPEVRQVLIDAYRERGLAIPADI